MAQDPPLVSLIALPPGLDRDGGKATSTSPLGFNGFWLA
jgi:hypothetical protein